MNLVIFYFGIALAPLLNAVAAEERFPIDIKKVQNILRRIREKDMPKEELRDHVSFRLADKEWMPQGLHLPVGDDVTPTYLGEVEDAYNIFMDESNLYHHYERPVAKAVELLTNKTLGYNQDFESIFIIHTVSGDADSYLTKNTMSALKLRNFSKRYNLFAVNMHGLEDFIEITIAKSALGMETNFITLGAVIGDFFNSAIKQGLMSPEKVHFIGFCFSSTLAGYVARHISSNNNNQKIQTITGMDPFSAGLTPVRNSLLTKSDANVVYVVHTNSMLLGPYYRATADFSFNSGMNQPGCSFISQCSHKRASTAFWYVVLYPERWVARKCQNWILFKTCLCNWNETTSITFPPVEGAKGRYYMKTKGKKPYGIGLRGAYCYMMLGGEKFQIEAKKDDTPKDVPLTL